MADVKVCPSYPGYCAGTDGRVFVARGGQWVPTGRRRVNQGRSWGFRTPNGNNVPFATAVLDAHVGPRPPFHVVGYRDGDHDNYMLDNLYWKPVLVEGVARTRRNVVATPEVVRAARLAVHAAVLRNEEPDIEAIAAALKVKPWTVENAAKRVTYPNADLDIPAWRPWRNPPSRRPRLFTPAEERDIQLRYANRQTVRQIWEHYGCRGDMSYLRRIARGRVARA